jgi:hypothetical protein
MSRYHHVLVSKLLPMEMNDNAVMDFLSATDDGQVLPNKVEV